MQRLQRLVPYRFVLPLTALVFALCACSRTDASGPHLHSSPDKDCPHE